MFLEFAEQSRTIFEVISCIIKTICNEILNVAINNAVDAKLSYSKSRKKPLSQEEQKKLIDDFNSKLAYFSLKPKESLPNPLEACKYLVCKNKQYNQYFSHKFENFDVASREEIEIINIYCKLFDMYISANCQNGFFHYEKDQVIEKFYTEILSLYPYK